MGFTPIQFWNMISSSCINFPKMSVFFYLVLLELFWRSPCILVLSSLVQTISSLDMIRNHPWLVMISKKHDGSFVLSNWVFENSWFFFFFFFYVYVHTHMHSCVRYLMRYHTAGFYTTMTMPILCVPLPMMTKHDIWHSKLKLRAN